MKAQVSDESDLYEQTSRNSWGSFRCSISSLCISSWCFLGNGSCVPLHHIEESALKCEPRVDVYPASMMEGSQDTEKGRLWFFFSSSFYTSLLGSIFLERLEHDLSGKMTMNQVRVLSKCPHEIYFAASAAFQVLPKSPLM